MPPLQPEADLPSRIAVRTPNWLGDLVLSTSFLGALLERFPDAAVDLVVRAGFEGLPLPFRGKVLPFDPGRMSAGAFGRRLRGEGYERFYVLPPSFSAAWMAFRSGARERIGYHGQLRGPLLRPALVHRARPRSVHLAREFLDLLDPSLPLERHPPRLDPGEEWVAARLARIGADLSARFAVLASGAVYGPAKEWPADHYADLARRLADLTGLQVVILGTGAERERGEQIKAGDPRILNLCGGTDLPGMVAVLARAALVVSNDSGAMHVAAALGRPQVALFGSTSPEWTRPLNPRAEVLSLCLPCAPCFARTCRYGHYRCLRELSPGLAFEKARGLLEPAAP